MTTRCQIPQNGAADLVRLDQAGVTLAADRSRPQLAALPAVDVDRMAIERLGRLQADFPLAGRRRVFSTAQGSRLEPFG